MGFFYHYLQVYGITKFQMIKGLHLRERISCKRLEILVDVFSFMMKNYHLGKIWPQVFFKDLISAWLVNSLRDGGRGSAGSQKYHCHSSEKDSLVSIHHNKFKCTHFNSKSLGSKEYLLSFAIWYWSELCLIFPISNKEFPFCYCFMLFIFICVCLCPCIAIFWGVIPSSSLPYLNVFQDLTSIIVIYEL